MKQAYFLGIDIGTQGSRVALIDVKGNLIATAEQAFPLTDQSREEQSPEMWWETCVTILKSLIVEVRNKINLRNIRAVSVTSTSGTVIPLDGDNRPLHPAIMYSDKRSASVAEACKAAALKFHPEGYTNFNASSGLSKMVWFVGNFPHETKKIAKWIHAADYITGKLCGRWDITDYTNALKSGYDLEHLLWPAYLYEVLPLKKEWLQEVVPSATPIAPLLPSLVTDLGLQGEIMVVAGMTDGCASQVASGAMNRGEWNTTIGTTLVIKGVTTTQIADPKGRLYNHRHPDSAGGWMPGGASNTGADWITEDFQEGLRDLNQQALGLIPTGYLAWPLRQQGERFPFIAPQARGFSPEGLSRPERYAANMEGVAYLERYAYEMIEGLSGEKVNAVFTAGGGSNSDAWLRIRSNVLNLPIYKMRYVTGAVGAAILAASKTYFDSVTEAVKKLTQIEETFEPEKELADTYGTYYKDFVATLHEKGYIGRMEL
jgi:sugar (pentulose or hexulose) kinase